MLNVPWSVWWQIVQDIVLYTVAAVILLIMIYGWCEAIRRRR